LFKNKYRIETTRLTGWDYAAEGWYFVTICTRNRQYFLGDVQGVDVALSDIGLAAAQFWREIPKHFSNAAIDEFIVMPNHVHGIVVIERKAGADKEDAQPVGDGTHLPRPAGARCHVSASHGRIAATSPLRAAEAGIGFKNHSSIQGHGDALVPSAQPVRF
jgi:hypothetical protein